jgi:hypothetical protein
VDPKGYDAVGDEAVGLLEFAKRLDVPVESVLKAIERRVLDRTRGLVVRPDGSLGVLLEGYDRCIGTARRLKARALVPWAIANQRLAEFLVAHQHHLAQVRGAAHIAARTMCR